MKKILFVILTIWSFNSYGQCINCTSFEEALKEPEKVKSLKINSNQHGITLDSVPTSIGRFINIEVLYLSDHPFETIPKEIGNLTELKELSFARCKLNRLPDEIFLLKNLKEMILLNNEFSEGYKKKLKKRFKKEMPNTQLLID